MLPRLLQSAHAIFPHLLPCSCALCGKSNDAVVCKDCEQQYFPAGAQAAMHCEICALALPEESASGPPICGQCLQHRPSFDATIVACHYEAPLDQLVLGLKFGAQLGLAKWIAHVLRDAMLKQSQPRVLPDLLCPVPLGQQRLRERGYNQALEIARPLSHFAGIRLEPNLCLRSRDTSAQSLLPLDQRKKNMRNAFTLDPQAIAKVSGMHIGVVDDVMTTGHTLDAMAAMLKHFGAARVSNFVFARTLAPSAPHP